MQLYIHSNVLWRIFRVILSTKVSNYVPEPNVWLRRNEGFTFILTLNTQRVHPNDSGSLHFVHPILFRREFYKGDVIISTKLLDLKAEGGITSQQPKFDAKTVVFLGGDIIYDAGLTEAILALIKATRKATFIFGVEKRFVFAVKELDVVAVHYKRFVEGLAEFGDAIKYREIGPEQIEKSYFSYERNEDLVIVKIVT